jgi:mRNA interferase MazF
MSPQPGDVWLADLGLAAKTRPVVIVSRFDPNAPRALVLYVPLTTHNRSIRYEVGLPKLPFLDRDSVANVQGLASLPIVRLCLPWQGLHLFQFRSFRSSLRKPSWVLAIEINGRGVFPCKMAIGKCWKEPGA